MQELFTILEIRFSIFASFGVFIFWIFKKEDVKRLKMFYFVRHFTKKESGLLEFIDVVICSMFYGIITTKLLEPTMDKQAVVSGITLINTLNFLVNKKNEKEE